MREIEFRGKTDENIWVFGNFVKTKEEYTKEISNAIINLDAEHRCCGEYLDNGWNEIDINTLGQYTGLKDKNGTKIFEGDIVKSVGIRLNGTETSMIGFVKWDKDSCNYELYRETNSGFQTEALCGFGSYEVIGNIHDNPELLKE